MTRKHRPIAREAGSRFHCRSCECGGHERSEDSNARTLNDLIELEELTIHADRLTAAGSARPAINAWGEVALRAERLLGRADASVIDAMRIIASLMGGLEMQGDAIRVLENAAERLVDAGSHRSNRGHAIAEEMKAIRRSERTTVLADSSARTKRDVGSRTD